MMPPVPIQADVSAFAKSATCVNPKRDATSAIIGAERIIPRLPSLTNTINLGYVKTPVKKTARGPRTDFLEGAIRFSASRIWPLKTSTMLP